MLATASLNDGARTGRGPGLAAAERIVATICDEAARRLGGGPEAGFVVLEVLATGPGRGIDYEEIRLDEEACLQLRALREALDLTDHGDPGRPRGHVSFDISPIPSATLRALFEGAREERLAALAALAPPAPNHVEAPEGPGDQTT